MFFVVSQDLFYTVFPWVVGIYKQRATVCGVCIHTPYVSARQCILSIRMDIMLESDALLLAYVLCVNVCCVHTFGADDGWFWMSEKANIWSGSTRYTPFMCCIGGWMNIYIEMRRKLPLSFTKLPSEIWLKVTVDSWSYVAKWGWGWRIVLRMRKRERARAESKFPFDLLLPFVTQCNVMHL